MNLVLEEDIVSLTDFARNTKSHTQELAKNGRVRVLTHNGKATAVVLSVAAYQELAHDAEEYKLNERLQVALEAHAKGERGKPAEAALIDIRSRAAQRRSAK